MKCLDIYISFNLFDLFLAVQQTFNYRSKFDEIEIPSIVFSIANNQPMLQGYFFNQGKKTPLVQRNKFLKYFSNDDLKNSTNFNKQQNLVERIIYIQQVLQYQKRWMATQKRSRNQSKQTISYVYFLKGESREIIDKSKILYKILQHNERFNHNLYFKISLLIQIQAFINIYGFAWFHQVQQKLKREVLAIQRKSVRMSNNQRVKKAWQFVFKLLRSYWKSRQSRS